MSNMSKGRQSIQKLLSRIKAENRGLAQQGSRNSLKKSVKTKSPATKSPPAKSPQYNYTQLKTKYKLLLLQLKDRDHMYQLQQIQLNRMKEERERNQKELHRLRSIIGFIRKEDAAVQVCMDMHSGGSWGTYLKDRDTTTADDRQDLDFSILGKCTNQSPRLGRKKSPTNRQIINHTFSKYNNPIKTANNYNRAQEKSNRYEKYNLSDNFESKYETNYQGQHSQIQRIKTESFYSPRAGMGSGRKFDGFYKFRESLDGNSILNKLSNSPYSKLKFSRNINKN